MRYKWLSKTSSNNVIIFFNGWGMDENVVRHLDREGYDVLMFYDYNTLDTDFDFDLLNVYSKINIVAWSMGVMVATLISPLARYLESLSYDGLIVAINGTLKPINEEFGIHPKIYDLTIKGFNEKGRDKFIKSMFEEDAEIACFRDLNEQQSELVALKKYCSNEKFEYNKILISDNDRIIPTKSQVAFWGIEPNLKGGHCPFLQFKKWGELL